MAIYNVKLKTMYKQIGDLLFLKPIKTKPVHGTYDKTHVYNYVKF